MLSTARDGGAQTVIGQAGNNSTIYGHETMPEIRPTTDTYVRVNVDTHVIQS